MKRLALITIGLLTIPAIASAFEGVVSTTYVSEETGNLPMEMIWFMDGENLLLEVKMEVDGKTESLFMLPNLSSGALYMYSETPAENGKNFYTEVSAEDISGGSDATFSSRLGSQKKVINERECIALSSTGDQMVIKMWLDKSVDFPLYKFADFFKTNYDIPALKAISQVGFPMESVTKDHYGNTIALFQVTEVEEKSLEDQMFQLPQGYVPADKVFEE